MKNTIGFSDDKILLATDNMNFNPDASYHNLEAFKIENIKDNLRKKLEENFDSEFVDKIMINNAKNIINELKKENSKTK